MSKPQSPFTVLQELQEEQREGYSPETITPTAMNTTENQNDLSLQSARHASLAATFPNGKCQCEQCKPFNDVLPADKWAAEKAAHAQGKRIECRYRSVQEKPWETTLIPSWLDEFEYRIAPYTAQTYHTHAVVQQRREEAAAINAAMNPAPAGKLTDEQRGEIGSKVASEMILSHSNKLCQSAFLFVTNGGMYEYGYNEHAPARTAFARAVREAVEKEQAEEIAQLTAIIEQSIEMVNTPGTTKGNLPKAINAKIMQRDEFHDATLKKLDAAKEDVKRLLKLDATNRENCDRTHKALVESQLLQLETQKALTAVTADLDRMQLEFKKQAEKKAFEEWWDSCDQFDNSKPAAWFVWQARAAKEGEK